MGNKLKTIGAGSAIVALIVLAWLGALGVAVLAVFMVIWNVTDIQNVGPNFWNVAWLILAAIYLLGLVASVFRKR